MGAFRFEHDPKLPAITIYTPLGRKIRITELPNGELRANFPGPGAITNAVLDADPVKFTLVPYAEEIVSKFGGAIGETITNTRRMVAVTRDVLSSVTGMLYQLGIMTDPAKTSQEKELAGKTVEEQIATIRVGFDATRFLSTMRIQLGNIAYDLKRLGQFSSIKASFSGVVAAWAGDNHAEAPIPDLFGQVTAKIANLPGAALKGLQDRWRDPLLRQPEVYAEIVKTNAELLLRESQ